jgi:hypothetical protein
MNTTKEVNESSCSINSLQFSGLVKHDIFSQQPDSEIHLFGHEAQSKLMKDFLTSVQEEFLLLNSRWKKREKTRLYRALARFGRHGIHQIAQRVRTKNIVQIQRYLHLLETLAQCNS